MEYTHRGGSLRESDRPLKGDFSEYLLSWVDVDFAPGLTEQCANFVRHLFGEFELELPVVCQPCDWSLTKDLEQGPTFANSFFGSETGPLISSLSKARCGDLLAFSDTYEGDFPKGCITHVGIYWGEGMMIHRGTFSKPVEKQRLTDWWRERLVEIRRPECLEGKIV